jgi:hypothetical protein
LPLSDLDAYCDCSSNVIARKVVRTDLLVDVLYVIVRKLVCNLLPDLCRRFFGPWEDTQDEFALASTFLRRQLGASAHCHHGFARESGKTILWQRGCLRNTEQNLGKRPKSSLWALINVTVRLAVRWNPGTIRPLHYESGIGIGARILCDI